MDKQLEERIRERAYELWMRHGSIHGKAEEYWYQAEREVLGKSDEEDTKAPIIDPAPLGMTSMTADEELLSPPPTPKTRKKRSPAAAPAAAAPVAEGGEEPVAAPKRRRTTRPA